MKNITLIKTSPSVQLGHVYEHLFLKALNEFFYDHKLFKYIDYSAHGTTFEEGGIVAVDCNFYSVQSQKLANDISQLTINFGSHNEHVLTALQQISAEEPAIVQISDKHAMLNDLKELDEQQWQHADAIAILDTKATRREAPSIYLRDELQPSPRKLQMTFQLNRDYARNNRELLPLFYVLSNILNLTLCSKITWQYGMYAGESMSTKLSCNLWIAREFAKDVNLDEIAELCVTTIGYVASRQTIERIAVELSSVSYHANPSQAPDYERILRSTGIFIGAEGWRSTATIENIQNLLAHSAIELRFGQNKVVEKLMRN